MDDVDQLAAELDSLRRRLARSEARLAAAQSVGQVGDWERDLATGEVVVSDHLRRVYGDAPGGGRLDAATLTGRVHPDDRAALARAEEAARRERHPVETIHRVLPAGGGTRWLRRRTDVVLDERGRPARIVATEQDITAAKQAELALLSSEHKAHTLMASVTDAIVGVDSSGRIVLVNERAEELFDYTGSELTGRPVELLLPDRFREAHERHRSEFMASPQERPMGVGLDLFARRRDGSEFPADIALRPLALDATAYEGTLVVAAVRDVTERKRAERAARELSDARQRRRQALEINDNVVQGLAAAMYALGRGDINDGVRTMHRTLNSAREMMRNLVGATTEIVPGELVRESPATLAPEDRLPARAAVPRPAVERRTVTVVIADDSADVRLALRLYLESLSGVEIVAEVGDGAAAVSMVAAHRPDVVLLDLAMPVMDGLTALPRIREASTGTAVIVLSGYGRDQVARQAIALGARAFVEKGSSLGKVTRLLQSLFPDDLAGGQPAQPGLLATGPGLDDDPAAEADLLSIYAHELRNPITALSSILALLREKIDTIPSSTVRELLLAMTRNVRQLDGLAQAASESAVLGAGELDLVFEHADLAGLVHAVVAELGEVAREHEITLETHGDTVAAVDQLRIRQVLSNLLSNAVKFSPRGSLVEIAVSDLDDVVEIEIADHGCGVDRSLRGRLFDKFTRHGRGSGVGLGLYISRAIVREHGGELILAETGPSGSTFIVTLPRVRTA